MNSTIKTYTIIAITLERAKKYANNRDERIAWRGSHLLKAARRAGAKYPGGSLKKEQSLRIMKELDYIEQLSCMGDGSKKITENLSFILAGVDEVLTHTRNSVTKEVFNEIANKAVWLNTLADPKLDREASYIKADNGYKKWTS